jgi:hypothetical protein
MAKIYNINTTRYLQGLKPSTPNLQQSTGTPTPGSKTSPNQNLGPTILTTPSSFKLSTNSFGGKRKKETITQIYLHHTAGHRRADKGEKTVGSFNKRRVSTHTIIDANGHIEYCVPFDHIAYGQGVWKNNKIGMSTEIQALGYFKYRANARNEEDPNGQFWSRGSTKIPIEETASPVDFNGKKIEYKYPRYQAYTAAQVASCIKWIKDCLTQFNIKWHFDQEAYNDMFPPKGKTSEKAISGVPGVYSHNSVRSGKSDVYPDPLLIAALKKNFPKK